MIQLILVLGLIGWAAQRDFASARSQTYKSVADTAKFAARFTGDELNDMEQAVADAPGILKTVSLATICEVPEEEGEDNRWFHAEVHIVHYDGTPYCDRDANNPIVAGAPWLEAAKASDKYVVRGPLMDPVYKKSVMVFAVALPADKAVIAYAMTLDSIGPTLDKQFASGSFPTTFVVTDGDRSLEIASSGRHTGRSLRGSGFASSRPARSFEDLEGTERFFASAQVPGRDWRIFAGISTSDALAGPRGALRERIGFAIVILLIVFAAAAVLQRRFLTPIRSLVAATKRFKDGDRQAAVVPRGPAELSALGESFNEMMRVRDAAETALQRGIEAEQRANSELRDVDEMRNSFLMAISHELRTPLTSVVGYSEFLEELGDELSREQIKTSISAIADQSKRLQRLLVDLLDVERLSRGTIEPNIKETNIRDVLMGVVERCSANGRIQVSVNGSVTSYVDSALTERMVENLVVNAIKHTPNDSRIWVKATRSNGLVRLTVEDSGPGVPDEMKATIFEPFTQGDVPQHSPGTGVGLSLVSQFAKLQGGRAWVEDRRGGGASFKVILPASDRSKHKEPRASGGRRRKVPAA